MTTKTTKVCPNCGNEHFHVHEISSRVAILDGNRGFIGYHTLLTVDEMSVTMTCINCERNYAQDDLVTDADFHEVISKEEFRDNALPYIDDFTDEQKHLMWSSQLTLYQGTPQMHHVIKDREKRFNGLTVAMAEESLQSDLRTLIVYRDGTHRANFSI